MKPKLSDLWRWDGPLGYRHRIWPAAYWQLWSDYIIHAIHRRVLSHVKALSEKPTPGEISASNRR